MNEVLQLKLEKPVYGGDCLGRLPNPDGKPGKTALVPLALPGETVSARVVEDKRSFLKAEAIQILTPSPHRVTPRCVHFGVCGGCQYQHADYPTQLEMKRQILREILSRANVAVPMEIGTLAGEPWAYRNRIRLALTPGGERAYRGRRSHDLIPIRECPIAAPILLRAAKFAAEFLRANPAPVPITEIELFTNPAELQLQLTLYFVQQVSGVESAAFLQAMQDALSAHLGIAEPGIWLRWTDNSHEASVAAALPPPSISYPAAGFDYRVEHGSFFQVNRHLIDPFVRLVTQGYSGNTAWDLYCGVGLFAHRLADAFTQVVAVEWSPNSHFALQQNLAETMAQIVHSPTRKFLERNRAQRESRPDFIVLDPPRAGLDPETVQLLNQIHAPEMVYVSCDPATFARDLKALTHERYRLEALTLVDMFPQTYHLETVARLIRR